MTVALLTREFPPEVYGGAGVHVEYLSKELARLIDLQVHCFGQPRSSDLVAASYQPWDAIPKDRPDAAAIATLSVDLAMALGVEGVSLVHSHTWYANMAGHLAKLLYGIPHVMTSHSLEPLRPWKAEQLGGGYAVSRWAEQTAIEAADAVIAVSGEMQSDIISVYPGLDPSRVHVIPNGVDPAEYRPVSEDGALATFGIDPHRPYALFIGRMTRQKGIAHLLDAAAFLDPGTQLVALAGAPDTPEIEAELRAKAVSFGFGGAGANVDLVWVEQMPPRDVVIQLLSHATVFVCPSVYEPFGLVNVEAMACGTAVVATAVGGIPEIVVDGETGRLVPVALSAPGEPSDPAALARDLATAINEVLRDPDRARAYGAAGRQRVLEQFTWSAVAARTAALYVQLGG